VHDDGSALAFAAPKVQASIAANTYVVSGPSTTKRAAEVQAMGGGMGGMGGANLAQMMAQMQAMGGPGGMGGAARAEEEEDDDDDVPDLVQNFDSAEA
jgi:nascent polypeptide-associated complex subunit beta